MDIVHYLAMTAAEIGANPPLPPKIAWMACHFSPYSAGLSNCPRQLPPGSLLILNDFSPIHGHSPETAANQLRSWVEDFQCSGVLLDFQRPGNTETAALTAYLEGSLPCPVAVSHLYADSLSCPVFLPPVPVQTPVAKYLAPWQGREIWLETALDAVKITLTEKGASFAPLPRADSEKNDFRDEKLHCRYRISLSEDRAEFLLYRAKEDLASLLRDAASHGVTTAVGLYQEWAGEC